MQPKKLVICGAGIKSLSHHTKEFDIVVRSADLVIYLVNEPLLEEWLRSNSKKSISLSEIYFSCTERDLSYKLIAEKVISSFNNENNICLVFYGHPLLLADSVSMIIEEAKAIDINVQTLPGISSFDCLLADLELKLDGCCFLAEASHLINNHIQIDITHHVILWQIGTIGINSPPSDINKGNISKLKNVLLEYYPPNSPLFLYEAAIYPHLKPLIEKTIVDSITNHEISTITTAYLPPVRI